jgi:uncharacterized protein YggT (Ycf19 family)
MTNIEYNTLMLQSFLLSALTLYIITIFITIIASWIPRSIENPILSGFLQGCRSLVDPYLNLWRKIIPPISLGGMNLDLSPLAGILVLSLLGRPLIGLL